MKIEKQCAEVPLKVLSKLVGEVAVGTVFRWGGHEHGPYLKLNSSITGMCVVDLKNNTLTSVGKDYSLGNYLELSAAKLVTGE